MIDFVGLTLEDAEAYCEKNKIVYRVIREDENRYAVTADYRINRINFQVDDGKVTSADYG